MAMSAHAPRGAHQPRIDRDPLESRDTRESRSIARGFIVGGAISLVVWAAAIVAIGIVIGIG